MGRKRKRQALTVLLNAAPIGELARGLSGELSFSYARAWLLTEHALPISLSLPLREDTYRGAAVYAFFDNLLPENDTIRRRLAEGARSEGTGPFELLAAIGRDCVGALQFLPADHEAPNSAAMDCSPVSEREIGDILRGLDTMPLGIQFDAEFRISIAGAQQKTALLKLDGQWCRPRGTTPTSHILKPPIGLLPSGVDLSQSATNEWLCLQLASFLGLEVANAELVNFDGVSCLVVERFDRRWDPEFKTLTRVPQEDLCQALGLSPLRKYESEGGPGIQRIMNFLDASDERARDRAAFMRAQLVFFMLAAIDGHAKNFSIQLLPTGFRLTPLYDIMTVLPALHARQLGVNQAKLAMAVGANRHYRLAEIQRYHWDETAKAAGFPREQLAEIVADLDRRLQGLDAFCNQVADQVSGEILESVAAGLKARIRLLTN